MKLGVLFCLALFLLTACGRSGDGDAQTEGMETKEMPRYNDEELVGTVADFHPDGQSFYVNHAEWLQRNAPGGIGTDESHGFHALITDKTVLQFENGTPAELADFKHGQLVKVLSPTEEDLPVEVDEITILDMTYEEKYERFLAHSEGSYNVTILHEEGELQGMDVKQIFGKLNEEVELNAGQFPYTENWVVDYKKELGIEKLPVILVFDTKKLLFKTDQEKELYKFFDEQIK